MMWRERRWEEAYPALQPDLTAEKKAINRAWSYLASKHYLVQCSAQRSPDAAALKERGAKLGSAFGKIEKQLTGSTYFGGATPGMVDIAWLPLLHRAAIIEEKSGYDFIGNRPKLKQWQRQLMSTDLPKGPWLPALMTSLRHSIFQTRLIWGGLRCGK